MATTASRCLVVMCCAFFCVSLLLAGAGEAQTTFEKVIEKPLFESESIAFGGYDNDGWPDVFNSESKQQVETR